MSEMRCPCGAHAWSRDELIAADIGDGRPREDAEHGWASILGPDDYYCADEDDVLLPGEAQPVAAERDRYKAALGAARQAVAEAVEGCVCQPSGQTCDYCHPLLMARIEIDHALAENQKEKP